MTVKTFTTTIGHIVKGILTLLVSGVLLGVLMVPVALTFSGGTKTATEAWNNMPHELPDVIAKQHSTLFDKNGKPYATIYTENRVSVPLEEISPHVTAALLATEDTRFYEHGAIDVKGTFRALINNLVNRNSQQGGSGLTQQLVENIRVMAATTDEELTQARPTTMTGKLQELRYAQELERTHSKDEILNMYLNSVYFGNNAYGIYAAAERYFSTTPNKLTIDQAALLIGVLKNPTGYDPIKNPEQSHGRRNTVLYRLTQTGDLTLAEYEQLKPIPTVLKETQPRSGCGESKYSYYCALVLNEILTSPEFGETPTDRKQLLATGDLHIHTALNPKVTETVNTAIHKAFTNKNRVAASVAVIKPGTGRITAIGQNRDYGQKKHETEIVYANTPSFQTGSVFKPIVTATGIEQGINPTKQYVSNNRVKPRGVDAPDGGFRNAGGSNYGTVNGTYAMRKSVNTYFVQLIADAGVKNTAHMAQRLGMTSIPNDLSGREASLALGAYETSPIQVANVYATFASRGVACRPHAITRIERVGTGEKIRTVDPKCHQAMLPTVADQVATVLEEPFKSGGTAAGLKPVGRRVAGKTGTTNNSSAAWFAGFTPHAAVSVWVGDPRGGTKYPLHHVAAYGRTHGTVYGGTVPGPIFRDVMEGIHSGVKPAWLMGDVNVSGALSSRVIPNVTGMGVAEAVDVLEAAGFDVVVGENREHKWVTSRGFVAEQTPTQGVATSWVSRVTVYPTRGTPKIVYPPDNGGHE